MSRPQAVPTVQADNAFTRVIEWRFAPDAMSALSAKDWPGNIRQLLRDVFSAFP